MKRRILLVWLCLAVSACSNAFESKPVTIVFVCQHGYGKSLVAARHFERKAAAHGLNVHVLARGLTPAAEVTPAIIRALAEEGFDVANFRPSALTEVDIAVADRIISFDVDVPDAYDVTLRFDDVPALSLNYGQGRDRITLLLDKFLTELLTERHLIETD